MAKVDKYTIENVQSMNRQQNLKISNLSWLTKINITGDWPKSKFITRIIAIEYYQLMQVVGVISSTTLLTVEKDDVLKQSAQVGYEIKIKPTDKRPTITNPCEPLLLL